MTWKTHLQHRLQHRSDQNLWRTPVVTTSPQSRIVRADGRELLNFCSNDYLGLANHAEMVEYGVLALRKWGCGSGASHLICGHSELHEQLESIVANFVGAERALVFSTGYMANLAVPQTFLDRHGLLIEDKLNHASLLDAARMTAATMKRYPHLDMETAERFLASSDAPQKMLLTDGVFSMDGDVAPLTNLAEICQRHDALLVVDDAHGFGVCGPHGGGCLQQSAISISEQVLMVGTFGKSAGSFGAFVAGDAEMVETLIQFARPYIYTTALPPVVVATTIKAIELMQREPQRRERLQANITHFRRVAMSSGLSLGNSPTAIQPLFTERNNVDTDSDESAVLKLREQLWTNGIWVAAIRPPTVPAGSSRLRITLTSEHTTEDIERLVNAITGNLAREF